MRGVEGLLDGPVTVSLFAIHHEGPGVAQFVENGVRLRPFAKHLIVPEEMIVPDGGMGDDRRLRGHRILFHDIAQAGIGVDHDLQGELLETLAIEKLRLGETLAE